MELKIQLIIPIQHKMSSLMRMLRTPVSCDLSRETNVSGEISVGNKRDYQQFSVFYWRYGELLRFELCMNPSRHVYVQLQ
jgi:hypothetical protein